MILTATPPPVFECGFEINIFDAWCGVTQESDNDFDWLKKTSDDNTFTDPEPSVDHTTHLIHGHYLYAQTGLHLNGQSGQLNLPFVLHNSKPQCLEFFYQISNDNAGQLNVYHWLLLQSRPSTPNWKRLEQTGDTWNRGIVTMSQQSDGHWVSFEAIAGIDTQVYIALDDVTITEGACPLENFTCTFEEGMCSIAQDTSDDKDWRRQQGLDGTIYSSPTVDHTLGTEQGYYIYVENAFWSRGGFARLITPTLRGVADGSPEACLTFFYHMSGEGVGELRIYTVPLDTIRGDPGWVLAGNRGEKWRGAEMDITLGDDFTIVFEYVRGPTYIGHVALDDISFQRGEMCPGHHKPPSDAKQATCDFEEIEICGYEQDQSDDVDWIWQNRAGLWVSAGPVYDHTTKDEFGFYLYIYGEVGHRKTARMISPPIPQQVSQACLDFWWHLYGNDEQILRVYCIKDGDEIPDTPLLSISGNHGDQWRNSMYEISSSLTPCRLVFEGTTGIHMRDDIAIDDVIVNEGQRCGLVVINPPTTVPPTTNNINCDFENTNDAMCGWSQSIRDGFDWVLYSGETPAYNTGPSVDHTLQTDQGHYMLIDSYEDLPRNSRAELISPLVSPSNNARCFTFWYFMNGINTNFLNIYIVPYGDTQSLDPNFQLFGNIASQWLEGRLSMPSSARAFYIIVEGTITTRRYSADIAVDDFSLGNGVCQGVAPRYPFVANCDFEGGMCGYTQPVDNWQDKDEFDWFLNSGPTGTAGSGPSADHTKGTPEGHYLYIEASQPRRPGDRARVISPVINYFNTSYCLVFYYHMSGDDTASLTVVQRGDYYDELELVRLTGPAGDGWNPYNIDIRTKYGALQIVFTGTVGNSFRGDIGLDDITLTPGSCGSSRPRVIQTQCEFEYGLVPDRWCQLQQSPDDQLDWQWFDVKSGETFPMAWPGRGSFIYVNGTNRKPGDAAEFQTVRNGLGLNHNCLQMLYAIQGDMRLDVIRVALDGSQSTLLSYTKPTDMKRVMYLVETRGVDEDYWVIMKATATSENGGFVILDNFFLDTDFCGVYPGSEEMNLSGIFVCLILSIFLVIVIVLIVMGVLQLRNNSPKSVNFA
nr:MAM and LDL-receptor class A domain-containing protein 1-like [Lytechinus pictus]